MSESGSGKRASQEKLGKLHGLIADKFVQMIEKDEAMPSDLSVMVKFLKDNDITASIEGNDHLKALADQLKQIPSNRPKPQEPEPKVLGISNEEMADILTRNLGGKP